ncbi:hypothetical protein G6M86_26375 (plasmid) [Agrobacterium tumefaciens]|uniref:Uncharacterized protein n=1 Tax=Agrobacterium tumefaciens TaxID=358 RepID=A0AAJ4N8Q4_AGRTU|nr:hypothetical protein G6M86_26375 [Agrobacterium tumefaciens]
MKLWKMGLVLITEFSGLLLRNEQISRVQGHHAEPGGRFCHRRSQPSSASDDADATEIHHPQITPQPI